MRNSINAVAFAAATIVMVLFLGCTDRNVGSSTGVSFVSKYAPIEFTFPAGWYENLEEHPYDLQCFSPFQRMNTGVFVYRKLDVVAGATPINIFWEQIDGMKSKRKHFQELEAIQKHEHGDKTVTSITYIGDRDSSRNCYRFSLIEFKADDSRFAVLIQVALPGQWDKSKSTLQGITQSARSLPDND